MLILATRLVFAHTIFFWVVFLTVFFIDVFFFFGGIQEKFASMIVDAGFQKVEYENLVGGVVAIHSGLKL